MKPIALPSTTELAALLCDVSANAEVPYDVDVRLCAYPESGTWVLRSGLSDYDPDCPPVCGASSVPGGMEDPSDPDYGPLDAETALLIAADLIAQCNDMHAEGR